MKNKAMKKVSKKSVMKLAHYYHESDYDGVFSCFGDALRQAWHDAKKGRWPVNVEELEGQRSERITSIRYDYLLRNL